MNEGTGKRMADTAPAGGAGAVSRRCFCGLAGGALVALGGCAINPATGEQALILVSAEEERRIGAREHPRLLRRFGGAYDEPRLAGYIAAIGGRLAATTEMPQLRFTFTVLNSPIVNAMALPGGYVYITRGLLALARSEAEVAGVLGHEIGHVIARHTAQRISRARMTQLGLLGLGILGQAYGIPGPVGRLAGTAAELYLRSFSREQEFEADMLGVRYMTRAGYPAEAMASFLGQLEAHSRLEARLSGRPPNSVDAFDIMSTHPRTLDRLQRAVAAARVTPGTRQAHHRAAYLAAIDGMVFGHDPDEGVIRGRTFLHRALRFRFAVPEGFRLVNRPEAVIARGHDDKVVILFDRARERFAGSPASYLAEVWSRGARLNDLETIEINGMPAATGWVAGRSRQGAVQVRLVAIRYDRDHIYRFTFAAPPRLMRRLNLALRRTTYSFRRLTRAEAAAIAPRRIRIYRTETASTVDALAQRMALEDHRREWFEVLNGVAADARIPAGRLVKLVV